MTKRQSGFTLIELITVVAIVAIIAAIAVPNLLNSRSATNESSAIATLRNLVSVQAHVINRKFIDIDGDGTGEYGFFGELSGALPPRNNAGVPLLPPLLASSFQNVQNGIVTHSGYNFRIFLPDAGGVGIAESAANYANVDVDHSEYAWCCYAWPADRGTTGNRVFFVNHSGEILQSNNLQTQYSGVNVVPQPDAAFPPGSNGSIIVPVRAGQPATDGATWQPIN